MRHADNGQSSDASPEQTEEHALEEHKGQDGIGQGARLAKRGQHDHHDHDNDRCHEQLW